MIKVQNLAFYEIAYASLDLNSFCFWMWENLPDFGELEKDMHESSKIFVEPVLLVASIQFPTQA